MYELSIVYQRGITEGLQLSWLEQYTHNVGVLGLFPTVSNTYFTQSFSGTHIGTHTMLRKDKKWLIFVDENVDKLTKMK